MTKEEMERYGKSYNPPEYFFAITLGESVLGLEQESGLLEFKDWLEICPVDSEGAPIPNTKYVLHLPDGSTKEGTLDDAGCAREEGIPPGKVKLEFPEVEDTAL